MKICWVQVSILIVMASIALAISFSDGFGNIGLHFPMITLLVAISLMFGITFSCCHSEYQEHFPTPQEGPEIN